MMRQSREDSFDKGVLRTWGLRTCKQSFQQHFVHVAAKPLLAVDFHDGHARIVASDKLRVGVDVDYPRRKTEFPQDGQGVVTQMTPLPRIQHHVDGFHVAQYFRSRSQTSEVSGKIKWIAPERIFRHFFVIFRRRGAGVNRHNLQGTLEIARILVKIKLKVLYDGVPGMVNSCHSGGNRKRNHSRQRSAEAWPK